MTPLEENRRLAEDIHEATGRATRPARSVAGLRQLPVDVLEDIDAIDRACGLLHVLAYLYHVTDASFAEIKSYVDDRRWRHGLP